MPAARAATGPLSLAMVLLCAGCAGQLGGGAADGAVVPDASRDQRTPDLARTDSGPMDGPPTDVAPAPADQGPAADAPPPCTKDCVPMVWVPKGTFLMGATHVPGESKPQHQVTLTHGFWLDKYEVSQKRYQACIDDGACPPPSWSIDGNSQHPVQGVSWAAATAYCKWTGKRLPTEAEWEHAGCGDGTRCYPWGGQKLGENDCSDKPTCPMAAHCPASMCAGGPCYGEPQDVQAFEATGNVSAYGAVNMAGNVWEWVQDAWTPDFNWCGAGCVDPLAPASSSDHVIKGGAWVSEEVFLRCAARYNSPGGFMILEVGLRCALDP